MNLVEIKDKKMKLNSELKSHIVSILDKSEYANTDIKIKDIIKRNVDNYMI